MASERLNLPPVQSVARITQPANEDTALFIPPALEIDIYATQQSTIRGEVVSAGGD
jgi:hypothetical protein